MRSTGVINEAKIVLLGGRTHSLCRLGQAPIPGRLFQGLSIKLSTGLSRAEHWGRRQRTGTLLVTNGIPFILPSLVGTVLAGDDVFQLKRSGRFHKW